MNAFFEIPGLNIYIQIAVTIISIAVHLFSTRSRARKETVLEIITIYSGFQMELAFAAVGIGLIGGIGFWIRSFWLPFIIAKTTFMWGAGITHILHILQYDNLSPSNTGIVVYWDFLLPVILIVLYTLYQREQQSKPSQVLVQAK